MRGRASIFALGLMSCGGSVLDGADAMPANERPSGQTLAIFTPRDCVDVAGKPVPRPATRISLLQREDAHVLLLEERPGYDSLVIHNVFQERGALVFQAISEPDDADPALHEYRIEWPGARSGQLTNAGLFSATMYAGGTFRAQAEQLSVACKLIREQPAPRLDNPGPVRYEEQAPAASSGGSHTSG